MEFATELDRLKYENAQLKKGLYTIIGTDKKEELGQMLTFLESVDDDHPDLVTSREILRLLKEFGEI